MILLLLSTFLLMGALITGHIAWVIVGISVLVVYEVLNFWIR
jgi:hypothetical protein